MYGKEEQAAFGTPYIDYGARQYSAVTGRWLAMDPMAEKYYGISPYAFCNNNPVNYVDPDGRTVKPKGYNELMMIRNTIPGEMREYVQIGDEGFIDGNLMNYVNTGLSNNFDALRDLVNSSIVVEVELNNTFTYSDSNGNIGDAFMSYMPYDSNYPEDRDLDFENVSGLSTGEMGFYGKTLFPDKAGLQNSPNGNIVIIVNSSLSSLGAAETFSHEGYGHALLYIRNVGDHEGTSHMPASSDNGPIDLNAILRSMILESRKETFANFNR